MLPSKGKGTALLLLAGKGGPGKMGPPKPSIEPDEGEDTDPSGGKDLEQETAGQELANALETKDHNGVYNAICAILDMHKGYGEADESAAETEAE